MSSFMRSLLRTTSMPADQRSPESYGSLPSNPSFNDFSMHIAQELDEDMESNSNLARAGSSLDSATSFPSFMQRSSHENRGSLDSVSQKSEQRLWHGRPPLPQGSGGTHKALPIPIPQSRLGYQSQLPMAAAAAEASAPQRKFKEGKIDGFDYYEFCELIRSSSL